MSNIFHLDDYRKPVPDLEIGQPLKVDLRARVQAAREKLAALQPPAPQENFLEISKPVLLYQVSWGRNAWHSTWISKYTRNTILHSWTEARKFVNERLKQGSSYRLLVTPGWYLQFDRKSYLVGEINTSKPFARLLSPSFLQRGITEDRCLKLLSPSSEIWTGIVPNHDSIIVQETRRKVSEFVAWHDRTSEHGKPKTPGRYRRVIFGKLWFFGPVGSDGAKAFDSSQFDVHILEDVE